MDATLNRKIMNATVKYDVSIPLKHFYDLVEDMRERLGDKALRCVGYGHVGDSNLHLVSFHFREKY